MPCPPVLSRSSPRRWLSNGSRSLQIFHGVHGFRHPASSSHVGHVTAITVIKQQIAAGFGCNETFLNRDLAFNLTIIGIIKYTSSNSIQIFFCFGKIKRINGIVGYTNIYKGIIFSLINDECPCIYLCYSFFIGTIYSKRKIACPGIRTDINICRNRAFGIYINIAIIKRKCTDFTIFSSIPQGTVCQIQIDSTITSISIESPGYSRISSVHIQKNRSAISSLNIAIDYDCIMRLLIYIDLCPPSINSLYIHPKTVIIRSNSGYSTARIVNRSIITIQSY